MLDQSDLQAIAVLISESIKPIQNELEQLKTGQAATNARLDKVDARLDKVDARLDGMDARLSNLEEDSKITRSAVNTLLEWAEQAQVEVRVPLYKKVQ